MPARIRRLKLTAKIDAQRKAVPRTAVTKAIEGLLLTQTAVIHRPANSGGAIPKTIISVRRRYRITPFYPPAKSSRYVSHSTSRIVKRNMATLYGRSQNAVYESSHSLNA